MFLVACVGPDVLGPIILMLGSSLVANFYPHEIAESAVNLRIGQFYLSQFLTKL